MIERGSKTRGGAPVGSPFSVILAKDPDDTRFGEKKCHMEVTRSGD